jgi:hypothetical protein
VGHLGPEIATLCRGRHRNNPYLKSGSGRLREAASILSRAWFLT